jgi:5'-3' exonuclease
LTSWAGRAVQRAFAAHVEQQKEHYPDERSKVKAVDFNHPENDTHSPDSIVPHKMTCTPPDNSNSRKQIELFDTSLEGLDAVQQAILQDEKTMERDLSTITDEMKEDILKLLELCGIPWIESPAEAEAQCAALEEIGLVDGIVTEDSDVFLFGGKKVYKVS